MAFIRLGVALFVETALLVADALDAEASDGPVGGIA